MTLTELKSKLNLKEFTDNITDNQDIKSVYTGDLLSEVMGNAQNTSLWLTVQTHINIVAVASLKDMPAIILVRGKQPENETLQKCQSEHIALLGSDENAFELSGKIYRLIND